MASGRVEVTQAVLPPLEEFQRHVADIFASRQLTNGGGKLRSFEEELREFLGADALVACSNGTLALQLALRQLGLNGKKVITTPFTYVATASALLWEGCQPVFADIDEDTLCLDPAQVALALREHPDAAGILPVHVFGNAADVQGMAELARAHGLKVLYDAAHAFGCELGGRSLFSYGDAATGSFHSTKLFHTVEGGCVVGHGAGTQESLQLLRAFGHVGDAHISLGINAKMSELHAAMGLCLLPRLSEFMDKRRLRTDLYDDLLRGHAYSCGVKLAPGLVWNHAYYPRIFVDEATLLRVMAALAAENIYPRRYFYPSLTQLPYISARSCPVAESVSRRIVCLPLWPDMDEDIIRRVAAVILAVS